MRTRSKKKNKFKKYEAGDIFLGKNESEGSQHQDEHERKDNDADIRHLVVDEGPFERNNFIEMNIYRLYECPVYECRYSHPKPGKVQSHYNMIHSGGRFRCMLCDKGFFRRVTCLNHIRQTLAFGGPPCRDSDNDSHDKC